MLTSPVQVTVTQLAELRRRIAVHDGLLYPEHVIDLIDILNAFLEESGEGRA